MPFHPCCKLQATGKKYTEEGLKRLIKERWEDGKEEEKDEKGKWDIKREEKEMKMQRWHPPTPSGDRETKEGMDKLMNKSIIGENDCKKEFTISLFISNSLIASFHHFIHLTAPVKMTFSYQF